MVRLVKAGQGTEVLLALLDARPPGIGGLELLDRLAAHGRRLRPDQLLVTLLSLEGTGHVAVERAPEMRFALTDEGRDRAYEVGGGRPVHLRLLMADLVDFTAFTARHGDVASRAAAGALHQAASGAVRGAGGEVVKVMGDGFLAWLPPTSDPVPVVAGVAAGCELPGGERWPLRAGTHVGHPIRHGGDLFGSDVNLVARLCSAAAPGELVSSSDGVDGAERLEVRGLQEPVAVRRVAIP
jgi:class 3 adenylate cyclase